MLESRALPRQGKARCCQGRGPTPPAARQEVRCCYPNYPYGQDCSALGRGGKPPKASGAPLRLFRYRTAAGCGRCSCRRTRFPFGRGRPRPKALAGFAPSPPEGSLLGSGVEPGTAARRACGRSGCTSSVSTRMLAYEARTTHSDPSTVAILACPDRSNEGSFCSP